MANKIDIIINAVDKASGPLGKIGGALGGLAKGALTAVAVGGAAAAAGLAAVGGAALKLAIDAAPLASIKAAFEGLAESAGSGGDAILKALQDASYGMVTNKDLMMSFNQAAQLVGQDFAVKLPDAMQYLGKVSLATGQDMGFMLDSLVKGVGRLSPMILDNLGIQVSLEEATANAAAAFGVEAEALSKSQIQTGMMNVVLEKLAKNTAAMPEVTGSATQQFAAFKTQLQNTKDEIGLALLPIFQKLLGRLNEFAKDVLPLVIDWVETKFIPALEATWAFIETNLIPIIEDLAVWLRNNLPPIIAALADLWNNTLLPALRAIWAFVQTSLIPIIKVLWDWLKTNLPPAIQTLTNFWNNTLLPVLKAVYKFLFVDMMPIWKALGELIGTWVVAEIKVLTGVWQNVLKPALEAIWNLVKTYVIPVFQSLGSGIGGVSGAIQTVVGWINTLTTKLKNIKLPDWLTPGSPTPFEMGLRGISDAMKEISTMRLPQLSTNLQYAGAAASSINNFYLTANYANAQSESTLAADVRMLSLLYG